MTDEQDLSWLNEACLIPAKSADKRPLLASWKEYQTRKPTAEEMAQWKSEFRPTAWALICGKVSNGIYVVDVDSVLAEHTVIGRWMQYFGPTKTVCTSGATPGEIDTGKRHFYFRDVNVGKTISWTPKAKAIDNVLVPPVDLKAEGGYVLSAGSKHPSGCIYSVIDDSPIKDVSYEMVVHTLEMVYRHWPLINTILPSYVTGTRTFWCTNLAGYAFHHKFSEEDALVLVRTLAYAAVDPISTEADITNAETAVRSTYARGRDGVSVGYKGESGPQGAGWSDDILAAIEALPDRARWPKGSVEFAEEEMRKRFGLAEREDFNLEERGGEIVVTPELAAEPKKLKLSALTEKTDASALDDDGKVNTFLIAEAIRENMNVVGVWNGDDFVGHFRYLNGAYIRCKKYIKQAARDALGPKARNFHIAEIMGHLEVAETVDLLEFDCEDGKVCVQNGILDVTTRTLEPHTPERYFMKRLPIDFDPKATCPTVDAYFEQWLPGHSKALYEIVANTLIGWDCPIQSVVILIGGGGNGKALALDTPIPTPSGWTIMGKLKKGDEVFDEGGNVCRVTHAFRVQHNRPCYRMTFSDGTTVVADAEHEWFVRNSQGRRRLKNGGGNLFNIKTTKELASRVVARTRTFPSGKKYSEHKWAISVALPLQTPDIELPMDPYVLGVWLGDGNSDSPRITCGKEDVAHFIQELKGAGLFVNVLEYSSRAARANSEGNAPVYTLSFSCKPIVRGRNSQNGSKGVLRGLGVLNNKHIPSSYLRGSFRQRLALLQGLMDTDGYTSNHQSQCEFVSVKKNFALDVLELMRSLGLKATMKEHRAKLYGRDVGPKYRLFFSPPTDLEVFRLARKVEKCQHQKTALFRQIISCEPVPSVPVRCIEVDSDSHLYLCTEAMIPTHNSTYLLLITKFLGEDNVSAIEMQAFGENRFASAKLLGKWANICSDMDKRRIKSTSEFKKLTGGDPIQGEIKHGALFTFFNKAKMMFSLNELPPTPDDTEAFYRRVFKLRFNAKFKGKVRKSQRTIMAECYKEFPGLLNRCIDVLPGLLDRLAFDGDSDDVDVKKENYHRESRPVYGFWEDRLVYRGQEEGGGEVVDGLTKDEVFTAFRKYREEQELTVLAYDTFFRKLKEEFLNRDLPFEIGRPRADSGSRKRVIVGLGFQAGPPSGPPSEQDGGPLEKPDTLTPSGPPSDVHLLQLGKTYSVMSKDEVLKSITEEAGEESKRARIQKDVSTKVDQQAIGSMDIESVNLDFEDPDNRILSIALIGDLHPNGQVFAFDDESETLATFIDAVSEYDGLLGWNSDYFDLPLMRARLGRDSGLMDGMPIVLDCMRTHKSMLRKNETDYSLDHVAKRHLGEGKIPFDFSRTQEIFDNDRETLKRYNLYDTKLVLRLNKMFGHWDTFNGIVKRAGLDSYNARKFAGISQKEEGFAWWRPLLGLVTQYCSQRGVQAPQWPTDEEKRRRREKAIERPGGFVEAPKEGHHQNLIEYDFASLYPSLIRSLNLGADSFDPEGEIHAKFGRYVRSPRSVVAAILDELVAERSADKAEYERRKAEGASPEELAALKGKIEAGKVLANSFYGQMYAPFSPLYHYESAKTITTTGQECVQLMLARMREMGYEVIAGDTDSTYIKVPPEHFNQESAMALSKELTAYVSEHFRKTYGVEFAGSFDFKGMLDHFYTEKKKFYAVLEHGKPMSSLGIKGYVRGNTPELQRDLQKKVFETMFSGGNIDSMLEAEGTKFLTGLDHTSLISWVVDRKGGKTAQAKAKRALKAAGIVVGKFEQVGFLIVGSGKKRKVLAAHRLPDGTVEWMWQGEPTLRCETNFLTPEEAAKLWELLLTKLDGTARREE